MQQYVLAIQGLNQQEAITLLQKKGLSTAQQEQILSSAGLLATTEALNAELVEEAILESNISGAKAEAILAELGLIDAKTGDVIATNNCTTAELAQALATQGIVGADAEAILSQVSLTTANTATTISFEGLTTAIKANIAAIGTWLTTNPVGWAILAVGAIYGLTKAYDALTVSEEEMAEAHTEAVEKVKESISEYEEVEKELKSLQDEYDTNKEKLEELYSLRENQTITQAEQEYLEQLEGQNEKLRKQIEYKQTLANMKATETEKEAVEILNQKSAQGIARETTKNGKAKKDEITDAEKIKENTSNINELTKTLSDYEKVINGIELPRDEIDRISLVLDSIQNIENSGFNLSERDQATKDMYQSLLDGTVTYEQYEQVTSSVKENIQGLIDENEELLQTVEPLTDAIVSTTGANHDLKVANEEIISNAKDAAIGFNEYTEALNSTSDGLSNVESSTNKIDISTTAIDNINTYYEELENARKAGADLNNTVFGNIDLNDRQILEWTEQSLEQYKKALQSWDEEAINDWESFKKDMEGSISTVFGTSENFDGIEIAFSPMLQTDNGAVLLSSDTVGDYINRLIEEAKLDDGKWDAKEIIELDQGETKAFIYDGLQVKNLLADIGDTAIQTGEVMHYIGKDGSVQMAFNDVSESAKEVGVSVETLLDAYSQLHTKADELKDDLSGLWDSESFKDAKDNLAKLSKQTGITESDIKELAGENEELTNLLNDAGISAQFVAKCFQEVCEGSDGFANITDETIALDQAIHGMDESLQSATEAKQKFDNAMKVDEYNTQFKNYQEAYSSITEMINKGEFGKGFWTTAEYLLGEKSFTMSVDEVKEAVKGMSDVFGKSAKNGFEFLDRLYAKKDILDDMDSSLERLADGSYDFNLKPEEFEEIGNALDLTTDEVTACVEALGMFGDFTEYDIPEVIDAFKDLSYQVEDTGEKILSMQGIEEYLKNLGRTGREIEQIKQDISESGEFKILNFNTNDADKLSTIIEKLKELDSIHIYENGIIDVDSLITTLNQNFGMGADSITAFLDSISNNLSNIDLQGAEGKISDFGSYVESALSVDDTSSVDGLNDLNEAAGNVKTSVDSVQKSLSDINNIPLVGVKGEILGLNTALGNTNNLLLNAKSKIKDINNTTIDTNITVPKVKSYKGTVGRSFSKGTLDDIPNTPITGYKGLPHDEKNALRSEYGQPELTVYPNGKTELTTKPTMSDLPKGTVIFNEEQTKRILKGSSGQTGRGYASGNVKKTTTSSTTSKTKSSSTDKSESKKDKALEKFNSYISKLFDWIEVRLDRVQRKIDNATKRAEFYLENDLYEKSAKQYEKAIKNTVSLIDNNQKGAKRYEKQANTVINKAVKDGLISNKQMKDIKKKVADGTINIKQYNERTQAVINSYKQFYDKSVECSDAVLDLTENLQDYYESLYNIPLEKATDKIDKFNESIDVLSATLDNISVNDYQDANKNLEEQLELQKKINSANQEALKASQSNLDEASKSLIKDSNLNKKSGINANEKKAIKNAIKNGEEVDLTMFKEGSKGYEAAIKYNEALKKQAEATQTAALSQQELQKQIRETAKAQFDNVENYYSKQIDLIQYNYDALNDTIKLIETRGAFVTAKYYGDQQKYEREKLKALEEERKSLLNQMSSLEQTPTGKYSEEWYDCNDAIQKVNSSIRDVSNSLSELNNKMNDTTTELIDLFVGVGDRAKNELNFIVDLMGDVENFDMNHMVTNEGLARLESYVANMQVAASQAGTLKNAVEKLQKAYDSGQTSVTIDGFGNYFFESKEGFLKTINDFYDKWQERISQTYEYQSKVIDFMRDKLKEELSAIDDVISAKKESLNAEKELRNYQKDIRNQTQDISSLQKQIAAVSGDNSEEGINKYLQLQKQLSDAEQQLEETEFEHAISEIESSLDKLSDEYEATITALSADTDWLLEEGNKLIANNSKVIEDTFSKYTDESGYEKQFSIPNALNDISGSLTDIKDALNGNDNSILNALVGDKDSIISAINKDNPPTTTPPDSSTTTNPANPTTSKMLNTSLDNIKTLEMSTQTTSAGNIGNITPTPDLLKDSLSKSETNKIKESVEAVFGNSKYYAAGNKSKASDYKTKINQYLFEKNKKVLSDDGLKQLRKIFNTDNAGIYQAMVDLSKAVGNIKNVGGFAKGGIAELIPLKPANEDGLAWVRNGEGFIAPEHVQPIKDLVNIVPQINDIIKPITLPDVKSRGIGSGNNNLEMNITLPNVTNYNEFRDQLAQDMKNSRNFEKFIQDMSINLVDGKANSLTKNRFNGF